MTDDDLEKLSAYYHSLLDQQRILSDAAATDRNAVVHPRQFAVLAAEFERIESDFPGFLPPFGRQAFLQRKAMVVQRTHLEELYDLRALQSYLSAALGKLTVAIETPESTPVPETREFAFVRDAALRRILERDYQEIQQAYIAKCWKSVVILAGSAIEAILTHMLLKHQDRAIAATKTPRGSDIKSDITNWHLVNLIDVAVELKLVSPSVERLSHSVRGYRNLVHPGNEIRHKVTFGTEEAKIAIEVVHMVHRDLSG